MRSLGLGVSVVSRAGALLRDILYKAKWSQWPTGWGRRGADSGSMSLATRSLSATDPNRGPGHAGRPQHLKSTWAAGTPCLARTLGTGSRSDIHAFCHTLLQMKRKSTRVKLKGVNPLKREKRNTCIEGCMKLLHNQVHPTHLVLMCIFEIVPREMLFQKNTSIQENTFLYNSFHPQNLSASLPIDIEK